MSGRLYLLILGPSSLRLHDSDFALKNYRPPHPMGVKGGCSPQNNLEKLRGY
jgi:hypothetical protein